MLTRSIRDSETSIDFVQGPPGSRRERVNKEWYIKVLKILLKSMGLTKYYSLACCGGKKPPYRL